MLVDGTLSANSPPPRHGFSLVNCGEEGFLLFGGLSSSMGGVLNDLWRFDGQEWEEITANGESN